MIGNQYPARPSAGDPISARWAQKVSDSIRAGTPIAGKGVLVSYTQNGAIVSVDAKAFAAASGAGKNAASTAPFSVSVEKKFVDGEYVADTVSMVPGLISLAVANKAIVEGWASSAEFDRGEREYLFDALKYGASTGATIDLPTGRTGDLFAWARADYPGAFPANPVVEITDGAGIPDNLPWTLGLKFPSGKTSTSLTAAPTVGDGRNPNDGTSAGDGGLGQSAPNQGRAYTDPSKVDSSATYTGRQLTTTEDMGTHKFVHTWRQYHNATTGKYFYILYGSTIQKSTKTHPAVPGTTVAGSVYWAFFNDAVLDAVGYYHFWRYEAITGYGADYRSREAVATRLSVVLQDDSDVKFPTSPLTLIPSTHKRVNFTSLKSSWTFPALAPALAGTPQAVWTAPDASGVVTWRRYDGSLIGEADGRGTFDNDPAFADGGNYKNANVGPDGNTSSVVKNNSMPKAQTAGGNYIAQLCRIKPDNTVEQYMTGNMVVHPAFQVQISADTE